MPTAATKSLPQFLNGNPVHLWGHEHNGHPTAAIGKVVAGQILADGIELVVEYAVEVNPLAKQVWDLIAAGVIRAYSLGFYVIKEVTMRSPQREIDALPEFERSALKSSACTAVYVEIEILEFSACLVSSNRETILRTLRSGVITAGEAERLELIREAEAMLEEMRLDRAAAALKAEIHARHRLHSRLCPG
jgi:hypothetical protein